MARATATIRQLKNKDTGIDLSVTSVKEVKALIGSAFEYEITVVSNLGCFKNAKHKESDNVQFTVFKKFSDFEEIHTKLNTKYTGTVFPQLPKKVIKVGNQVAKERRGELDHFLKFLAMTDKLSCCPLLLEFLGINSVKASNFRKPDSSTTVPDSDGNQNVTEVDAKDEDLFEDGDQAINDEEDIFSDSNLNIDTQDDTKIFDNQDLGGALADDDDSDLFVPEARSHVKGQGQTVTSRDQEDNEDLLRIEDDFEDLVKLGAKPSNKEPKDKIEQEEQNSKPSVKGKPDLQTNKPNTDYSDFKSDNSNDADKTINQKPNLPKKPKPVLLKKPGDSAKPVVGNKPDLKQKPALAAKPGLKSKPVSSSAVKGSEANNTVDENEAESSVANLNEDDILKYIQENDANNDDELDLFS